MEILSAQNISKSYAHHQALLNIDLSIPKQSIFGLLGPNGAGKTTLIRIITQIIEADRGEVFINGEKLDPRHIEIIGYLPEERGLYKKMKVGEQLMYLVQLKGLDKRHALEKIRYWMKKFDISAWWGKNVEELSKGMQQKVQFIATVMHEPELIILDEPFSGFDPINANLIKDEILELRKNGSTIIFSTHRMESVEELCDHIALINQSKKILDGTTKEIKASYKTNTFKVLFDGSINLPDTFEVQDLGQDHGMSSAYIKITNGQGPNILLSKLMENAVVHHFEEKIPSINDIFISKVNEMSHE